MFTRFRLYQRIAQSSLLHPLQRPGYRHSFWYRSPTCLGCWLLKFAERAVIRDAAQTISVEQQRVKQRQSY